MYAQGQACVCVCVCVCACMFVWMHVWFEKNAPGYNTWPELGNEHLACAGFYTPSVHRALNTWLASSQENSLNARVHVQV